MPPANTALRKLGTETELHYSKVWSPPVWVHLDKRDTLAIALGGTRENVQAEDSKGWQWEQEVSKSQNIVFSAFFNQDGIGDTVYADLIKAKEDKTPLVFAIAEGPIATAGTKYRKIELYIGEINDNRDVKGVGKIDVTTYQGPTSNHPTTETVPTPPPEG